MPVPDRGDQPDGEETTEPDPDAQLRADMAATQGGTSLIATDAEGWGAGTMSHRGSIRFGANPPMELKWWASEGGARMLACYGLSAVLTFGNAQAGALREQWRTFLSLTARPLARMIAAKLSAALDVDVLLDLAEARSADVVMLSRAVGSLQKAGVDVNEARRIVGLQ